MEEHIPILKSVLKSYKQMPLDAFHYSKYYLCNFSNDFQVFYIAHHTQIVAESLLFLKKKRKRKEFTIECSEDRLATGLFSISTLGDKGEKYNQISVEERRYFKEVRIDFLKYLIKKYEKSNTNTVT